MQTQVEVDIEINQLTSKANIASMQDSVATLHQENQALNSTQELPAAEEPIELSTSPKSVRISKEIEP